MLEQPSKPKIPNRGRQIVKLTKKEIGILKAALQYYLIDNEFGYAKYRIWNPNPSYGVLDDAKYENLAKSIYAKLDEGTKIKSDFGYWNSSKQISDLMLTNLKRYGVREYGRDVIEYRKKFKAKIDKLNDLNLPQKNNNG